MAHSTEIANEFIKRSLRDRKPLTQMQLQKLVYIAHGWDLAINNLTLTDDSPQAWDYGPVYPQLWDTLKVYGSNCVTRPIQVGDSGFGSIMENASEEVAANLSPSEVNLIDQVYTKYSGFHAFQLSAMTHREDTPWHKVYVEEGKIRGAISDESIKNHFVEIAQQRQQ